MQWTLGDLCRDSVLVVDPVPLVGLVVHVEVGEEFTKVSTLTLGLMTTSCRLPQQDELEEGCEGSSVIVDSVVESGITCLCLLGFKDLRLRPLPILDGLGQRTAGGGKSIEDAPLLRGCSSPIGPQNESSTGKKMRPLNIPSTTSAKKHRKKYLQENKIQ